MLDDIVRDMLTQQRQRQEAWLAERAEALGLSVEELAELCTLEVGPLELVHDEDTGVFRAEQVCRLRVREGGL